MRLKEGPAIARTRPSLFTFPCPAGSSRAIHINAETHVSEHFDFKCEIVSTELLQLGCHFVQFPGNSRRFKIQVSDPLADFLVRVPVQLRPFVQLILLD